MGVRISAAGYVAVAETREFDNVGGRGSEDLTKYADNDTKESGGF